MATRNENLETILNAMSYSDEEKKSILQETAEVTIKTLRDDLLEGQRSLVLERITEALLNVYDTLVREKVNARYKAVIGTNSDEDLELMANLCQQPGGSLFIQNIKRSQVIADDVMEQITKTEEFTDKFEQQFEEKVMPMFF